MALSTPVSQMNVRDNATFALVPPSSVNAYKLVANTAQNINVSALTGSNGITATALVFSCNADFYVLWNGTGAAVPAANILTGASPELNPTIRHIPASITSFSLVAPADCILTVSIFYLLN